MKFESMIIKKCFCAICQTKHPNTKINVFRLYLAMGKFEVKKPASATIFPNNFFIMYLGCIYQPMKLVSLFHWRFGFTACQTGHPETNIYLFRIIFTYGQNLNSRALENQLHILIIFFPSYIWVSFFWRRGLNQFLFPYLTQKITPTQQLRLLVLDLAIGKFEINQLWNISYHFC